MNREGIKKIEEIIKVLSIIDRMIKKSDKEVQFYIDRAKKKEEELWRLL